MFNRNILLSLMNFVQYIIYLHHVNKYKNYNSKSNEK